MRRTGCSTGVRAGRRSCAAGFNLLNHPNFSNPRNNSLGTPLFGIATQMANAGLGGVYGAGTTSLYESGGPRSMQLSLRLEF